MDYTALAEQWQEGSNTAGNRLVEDLHSELHAIAAARLRHEPNSSLSTGDLVNEAVIKLARLNSLRFTGRAHILAMASRLMRQILIDQARKRASAKRQNTCITLTTNVARWEMPVELIALDLALNELSAVDPERAQIVEMRFFGGMSCAQIADVLGISEPTVKRRWTATRAWLLKRLSH